MALWQRVRSWIEAKPIERQGDHADPAVDPPPPPQPWARACLASPRVATYRECFLLEPDDDPRTAVLRELGAYYGRSAEDTLQHCIHWEDYSLQEWQQAERSSPDGLRSFFQQCESWSYDLLWDAYLQSTGHSSPLNVAVVDWLAARAPVGTHLDFGSGVGVTSQLFQRLGWSTTLADVSIPLLEFARWRLDRRGIPATYHDLRDAPATGAYDVVTALGSLIHVPDLGRTLADLHAAMTPGGLLFSTFDVRPPSDYNAWHLYEDADSMRWAIERSGFIEATEIAGGAVRVYRRSTAGLADRWRLPARYLQVGPPRQLHNHIRRVTARQLRRTLLHLVARVLPLTA